MPIPLVLVLGPTASAVTSSQTRALNPAASITRRISAGARRKLEPASRAHMTGNTTGWTGPAMGSCSASRPPGRRARAKPAYRTLPGWQRDISSVRRLTDFPKEARAYLDALAELIGRPVEIISVGPDREQTVFC